MNKAIAKLEEDLYRESDLFRKVRIRQNFIAYGFLTLPLLLLAVFTFFPLFHGIYISFLDYNIVNMPMIGGPVAFIQALAGNLGPSQKLLALGWFIASIALVAFIIKKKAAPKIIWLSIAGLIILNLVVLGSALPPTLREINYTIEEDRTLTNDLVPRYLEMLREQYGTDVPVVQEKENDEETRVYIKQTAWVGVKHYRSILTNHEYVEFLKENSWYIYLAIFIIVGFVALSFLKKQKDERDGLYLTIRIIVSAGLAVFAVVSWNQIFHPQSWSFYQALKNSIKYVLVVPPIQIASILLAILINQKIKGITFFRTIYYVPVITGVVIIGYCWKFVFQINGLVDSIVRMLGMEPLSWLGDPRIALYTLMFVTFWRGLGYYMVLYLAGIQDISHELLEAAKIDGASVFQLVTRIYIPLLRRTILVCSVLSMIAALRVFEEIYVMSGGSAGSKPMNGTVTMVYEIFDRAFGQFGLQFSYSAALAVMLSAIIAAMTIFNFKLERSSDD